MARSLLTRWRIQPERPPVFSVTADPTAGVPLPGPAVEALAKRSTFAVGQLCIAGRQQHGGRQQQSRGADAARSARAAASGCRPVPIERQPAAARRPPVGPVFKRRFHQRTPRQHFIRSDAKQNSARLRTDRPCNQPTRARSNAPTPSPTPTPASSQTAKSDGAGQPGERSGQEGQCVGHQDRHRFRRIDPIGHGGGRDRDRGDDTGPGGYRIDQRCPRRHRPRAARPATAPLAIAAAALKAQQAAATDAASTSSGQTMTAQTAATAQVDAAAQTGQAVAAAIAAATPAGGERPRSRRRRQRRPRPSAPHRRRPASRAQPMHPRHRQPPSR